MDAALVNESPAADDRSAAVTASSGPRHFLTTGEPLTPMPVGVAPVGSRPDAGAHQASRGWTTRGRTTRWERLAVVAIALILAVALFHHAWAHPRSLQVGDPGDADEYDWFLAWVPWAIGHGINPLLSTFVNAPKGANLMWNTSVVLPGFIISPLTIIFGAPFSYNTLVTLAPALGTLFAYIAFRRWSGRLPALAGSLVFGFCPYVAAQSAGHLAQVLQMSVPLLLIVLDRLIVVQASRPWRDGLMLGVLAWAQLLTGEELLAMEAAVAVGTVIVLALIYRRAVKARASYAWRGLVVGGVSCAVLSAPFIGYQYLGPYKVQDVHPANIYVSDLLNFIIPTNMTRLAPTALLNISDHFTGNGAEEGAYIGLPLLVVLVFAIVVGRRRPAVWAAVAIAVIAGVFSMGPTLHVYGHVSDLRLPGYLLQKLPAMKNLLPDRFAGVMFLGVGMLLALGLTQLAGKAIGWKIGTWAVTAVGLLAIVPTTNYLAWPSPDYPAFSSSWACPTKGTAGVDGRAPVALFMPADNELNLLWQAEADFCFATPTATGMTGTHPVTKVLPALLAVGMPQTPSMPALTPDVRSAFANDLKNLHVNEVIVAPEFPTSPGWTPQGQAQLVAWLTSLLGKAPAQYAESYFAYVWKDLPPTSQIASGKFT